MWKKYTYKHQISNTKTKALMYGQDTAYKLIKITLPDTVCKSA